MLTSLPTSPNVPSQELAAMTDSGSVERRVMVEDYLRRLSHHAIDQLRLTPEDYQLQSELLAEQGRTLGLGGYVGHVAINEAAAV